MHNVVVQAFIKLQSLSELMEDQQEDYEALALDIFTRYVVLIIAVASELN